MFNKQDCPYYETKCNDYTNDTAFNNLYCPCAKFKAFLDVQNPIIVNKELNNLGISDTMNLFEKVFYIQKHFASCFHDVEHISKDITDYWAKEYTICLEDEIEELFDYIHLEDNHEVKTDIVELKKEIADILHFVLDEMIAANASPQIILDIYKTKYLQYDYVNDPLIDIFNYSVKYIESTFFVKRNYEYDNINLMWNCIGNNKWNNILLTLTLRLLFINREIRQQISWKHWKKPYKTINYLKLHQVCADLLYQFMLLAAFIFDSADEIANIYIRKNIENIRRQVYHY